MCEFPIIKHNCPKKISTLLIKYCQTHILTNKHMGKNIERLFGNKLECDSHFQNPSYNDSIYNI